MAIKRTSSNSLVNATKMSTGFSSAAIPNTPTIGSATATSDVAATVAYTAAVLGANGVTFTATSNPSSITGTGSSPITVTGLTASTSYTFSVTAGNANGTSAASSASNSITTSAPLSSYESIATVSVSTAQAEIEFTSIPATYTHLQIRGIARVSRSTTGTYLRLRFNNDSTTAYSYHGLEGNGSTTAIDTGVSQDFIETLRFPGATSSANIFGAIVIDILDYANTSKYKTARLLGGADQNGSGEVWSHSGNWRNTTAISSIKLLEAVTGNFVQYSHFALYGIKGA